MQKRNGGIALLVGAVAVITLLGGGAAKAESAATFDFAALAASDCALADNSDMSFVEPTTPAPNTPDDKQPKSCRINGNCWKPAYCAKEVGTCKGKGVCKAKPETCPADVVDPVCGCNKKTYNNDCLAAQAGTNVSHKGACEKKGRGHRK